VESLESRTVLSAAHLAAVAFSLDPPHVEPFPAGKAWLGSPAELRLTFRAGPVDPPRGPFGEGELTRIEPRDHEPARGVPLLTEAAGGHFFAPVVSLRSPLAARDAFAERDSGPNAALDIVAPIQVVFVLPPTSRFDAVERVSFVLPTRETAPFSYGQPGTTIADWLGNDPVAPRANSKSEGGLADISVTRSVPDANRPNPFMDAFDGLLAKPPASRSSAFDTARPSNATVHQPLSWSVIESPGARGLDSSQASRVAVWPPEGGLVSLSAADPLLSTAGNDRLASWDAPGGFQSGVASDGPAATHLTRRDDAGAALLDPFGRSRLSGLDNRSEGGFVEIDEVLDALSSPSGRDSPEEDVAVSTPTWSSDRHSSQESISRDILRRFRSLDASRSDGDPDQGHRQLSEEGGPPENLVQSSRLDPDAGEGGMIELIVAASLGAGGAHGDGSTAVSVPGTAERLPEAGVGQIRMDSGVGLFQAFELATGPALPAKNSNAQLRPQQQTGQPPARTASDTDGGHSATPQSASVSGAQPLHHAAVCPVILVISYLLTAAGNHSRKERRESFPSNVGKHC
jgi:hypothetical protein